MGTDMLEGDRLTLRPLTPDDYPRLVEFKNDPEFELLGSGQPPRPTTLQNITDLFAELAKDKDLVNFAIEADGIFIGDIGLYNVNRVNGTAEIGIGIGDRSYWGRGYGREAISLLVDYAFRMQNLRRVWLEVSATNDRAIACYRSCGFVEEGQLVEHEWINGSYVDVVLMGRLRSASEENGA